MLYFSFLALMKKLWRVEKKKKKKNENKFVTFYILMKRMGPVASFAQWICTAIAALLL